MIEAYDTMLSVFVQRSRDHGLHSHNYDSIGGRSKATGLKKKMTGGFSRGITLGFFNSSNRARVLACFFVDNPHPKG